MCGIAGWIDLKGTTDKSGLECVAARMADSLFYRGPDDRGVWGDPEAGIALGHRRLSIVDLSTAGHQPMLSRPAGLLFHTTARFTIELTAELLKEFPVFVSTDVPIPGHAGRV
jgi:asparagine synthetase B (glutamine-hydrolysing)